MALAWSSARRRTPKAKLIACARNDKLFSDGADLAQLAKEIRYVIGGTEEIAKTFRVIALPESWLSDPWLSLDEAEQPERWDDRLPILVLPEETDKLHACLGRWLKDHLQKRRNTVRFLLPRPGSSNVFQDRDLLILARAEMKAQEWVGQEPEYKKLQTKYQGELRDILKQRYNRFAVLHRWNFTDSSRCIFSVESLRREGAQIPGAIEESLTNELFVPEDFEELVLEAAAENSTVGKLLRELQEPRPAGLVCIPWLGETKMKERILRLCARGKIAINLRGMEFLQAQPGEDEDNAWNRLRSKFSCTGRHLDEVSLLEPSAVPTTGGQTPVVPQPEHPPEVPKPGTPAGGDISGGGATSGGKLRVSLNNPPTSPLNLIGKIEAWGIGPATQVAEVSIKVSDATGAQLQDLIKKLPDGMTFALSLEKVDD